MNPIEVNLTEEDYIDYSKWLFSQSKRSDQFIRLKKQILMMGIAFPIAMLFLGILFNGYFFGIFTSTLLLAFFVYVYGLLHLFPNWKTSARISLASNTLGDPRTVSLAARGVLEVDDCEERLTLYDSITEVELTETFFYAKDKRGGVLVIPIRAFGSETAAQGFLMELQHRRMKNAVGLQVEEAPTEVVAQQTTPVAKNPWWRSAPPTESEAQTQRRG